MITAKKQRITSKWAKLLRLIPNYDPIETAEDCEFDPELAQKAIDFFTDHLVLIEGDKAGQPFELEDWQKSIVANLFGWLRPDETRRYREAFLGVPRKNGKTPFAAGIINLVAFCDGEPGAQIYSSAGERDQAALIFRHAAGMIARNKELSKRCRIYRTYKSIEFYNGDVIYKALTADADTKHGLNGHLIVNDELHIQPNRDLIDTLETSTASRRQPLILHITTAGFDKHTICYEKYDYAKKIIEGIITNCQFLPVIYEADPEEDWKDEKVWAKANPNLGVSVSLEYLRNACKEAQDLPAKENTFKRLHLNLWTEQETRWMSMDVWNNCPKREIDLVGRQCFAGLDLSETKDITAFVLLFPDGDDVIVVPKFWIPKDNIHNRVLRDKVPYDVWVKQGFITATPGNVIDYGSIEAEVAKACELYDIQGNAYDRFGFEAARQRFVNQGIPEDIFVSFGQGFLSMSAPMKDVEKRILSRHLIHNDNPVLSWMASNVAVKQDEAGNIKPDKKRSREKIDGIVATIMANGLYMVKSLPKKSVYESRGAITL